MGVASLTCLGGLLYESSLILSYQAFFSDERMIHKGLVRAIVRQTGLAETYDRQRIFAAYLKSKSMQTK